jgi:hypothetical protein
VCVCEQRLSSVCVGAGVWGCGGVCGVSVCNAYVYGLSVYIVCLYVCTRSCSYVNVYARVCVVCA